MFVIRGASSLWSKSQAAMPYVMVVSMAAIATVPPISGFTWAIFVKFWVLAVSQSYVWAVLVGVAILLIDTQVNDRLEAMNKPLLEKSFFRQKGNVAYGPVFRFRRLAPLYVALLALCMPLIALAEELIFRELTSRFGLLVLLLVSGPVFGLIHLTSGANLRRSVCMVGIGLVMAGIYLLSGLLAVFVVHASYNLSVVAWLAFDQWVKPLAPRPTSSDEPSPA